MKEELTNLVNEYSCSKSGNDYKKIIEAIEKYDRYIFRLNLEAQRHFDMLMDKIYGKAEIIEEDKPIEELLIEQDCPSSNYYIRNEFGTKCGLTKHSKMIAEKVNEIAREVNKLKKESDK